MKQEKFLKTRRTIAYMGSGGFLVFLVVLVVIALQDTVGTPGRIKEAKTLLNSLTNFKPASLIEKEEIIVRQSNNTKTLRLTRTGEVFFVPEDINKIEKWIRKNNFSIETRSELSTPPPFECSLLNIVNEVERCFYLSSPNTENKNNRMVSYFHENEPIFFHVVYSTKEKTIIKVVLGAEITL